MTWETKLFDGWDIGGPIGLLAYVEWVFICTILVRAFVAWVRAIKPSPIGTPLDRWTRLFFPSLQRAGLEYDLDPTIIGTFELAAYPILMKLQAWPVIGAWIAFKTYGQWKAWTEGRALYNYFLIGNATVLALSFWLAFFFVHVPSSCTWQPCPP